LKAASNGQGSPVVTASRSLDLAPLPASTGDRLGLDRFFGKVPVVLAFTGSAGSAVTAEVVRGFDEHLADFGASRVQALVLVSSEAAELDRALSRDTTTVPVLADEAGEWRQHFGVAVPSDAQVTSLLLDPEGNVVDRLVTDAGGVHAGEALAMVDRWTASACLPSSTFAAGPFAPGAHATDGTAGLVTNVEGDAPSG
jgi:peroxiredoxin